MKSTVSDNNEYRMVSNKKNIVKIIVGSLFLILAGIEIVVTVLVLKKDWMTNLLDALSVAAIISGAIILLLGIIECLW